ncbi:hypothetical protein HN51_005935, partial [Arachis hypogaea]
KRNIAGAVAVTLRTGTYATSATASEWGKYKKEKGTTTFPHCSTTQHNTQTP